MIICLKNWGVIIDEINEDIENIEDIGENLDIN